LRLAAEDTGFAPVNYDTVILASGDTARIDPFYLWAHQAILSIDVVAAGLGPDDTVYNFPLLLRLNSGNFDFSTTKKKGTDFRAAKDGGVPVPFEIEWWDSAGATAAIWILADTLYGSPSPLSLRLCWGNRSMKSVSHSNSVFDTAAGFAGVWHLGESGGTMQKDATVHQIDAVPQNMDGSNDVPGIIGRAQRFDGDKDSGSIGIPVASEALSDDSSGAATVSFWAEVTAADSIARWLISPATSRSGVAIDGNGRWVWTGLHSDATADSLSAPARTGVWTLLTAVKRGASRYLYVDGVVVDSSNSVGGAGIGSGIVLGAGADGSGWFTGIVDELRLYHTAVSPAWIRLRYETEREDQRVVSIEPVR
jgi:biopolymer transport protein ExbB